MLPSASKKEKTIIVTTEARMIATMRLVLASSALMIIYLDPSEPDRLVQPAVQPRLVVGPLAMADAFGGFAATVFDP